MKKIIFLLSAAILTFQNAHAICPFHDIFNVTGSWGYGVIKVLEITPMEGDNEITIGESYNPSWPRSFVSYTSFTIEDVACSSDMYEHKTRYVKVKIGYDDKNYCTVN